MRNAAVFICGFVLGVAAIVVVPMTMASPAALQAPQLKQAKAITIFLHPWGGYEAATNKAVRIPTESQEEIFRRLVPGAFYGKVNEHIVPLVAEAVVTHADGTQTRVLVREGGVNPAVVSVDGVNYFYAKNEPHVYAGANEFIKMVAEIAYAE